MDFVLFDLFPKIPSKIIDMPILPTRLD